LVAGKQTSAAKAAFKKAKVCGAAEAVPLSKTKNQSEMRVKVYQFLREGSVSGSGSMRMQG
jgi:hypothetical protein